MQVHDDRWLGWFRARGHAGAETLATGMEGAVYRLGGGLVAKVWGGERPHGDLLALQRFHADLAREALPFATPEIVEVAQVDGTSVTVERELPGRPLRELLPGAAGAGVPGRAADAVALAVEALAGVPDLPSAHALPVLSEPRPFRGDLDWPAALVALLDRRVARFGDRLGAAVDDFPDLYGQLVEAVSAIGAPRAVVVHGDVCPENVLVDGDLRPTALLDWGFLSTAGDPAFDAAVAAGILDMYGPGARATDDHLLDLLGRRLRVPRDHLLVHRAAYAVATANAYDPDGRDGHFAWCAATLRRPDVRDALRR